ncbi:MAG: CoA transferase, partial [Actinomycetota bacterium]|nr:CoA transferase [Actinomycetota bacterium]
SVEPLGGHRTRHRGPFVHDVEGVDRSLSHWAHNRGKTSIVVSGLDDLEPLLAGADAVIEGGVFEVDLARMREDHPHLVTVSISAFGSDGPKADWPATDLTITAAGGAMSLSGDADRAPLRMSAPQAWRQAGVNAACGALMALHEARRSGLGQHVDVSAQQAMLPTAQMQMMYGLVGQESPQRLPGGLQLGPFRLQFVHPCLDGFITVMYLFGPMIGPYTTRLFTWIHEEGHCGEDLRDKNWIDFGMAVFDGTEPASEMDRGTETIARFVATKTKDELLAVALERNLLIGPVSTTSDVLQSTQLVDRGYWDTVEVPGVATTRFPGLFAKMTTGTPPILGPPPSHGGVVVTPRDRPTPASTPRQPRAQPLDGVKVCDLMWAIAGPGATRMLADHGACVVRIENSARPDVIRSTGPFLAEEGDTEGAFQFHSANAGKMGLTLDLSTAEGRGVLHDLVRWADVVTESFSPGAVERMGFGYDQLQAVRPDLIMVSSCLMGQTGPMRDYAGFGTMAAALAGFYSVTGWPDRTPAGVFGAYTDYVAQPLTAALILAALHHRDRTGEGAYVDYSQFEGALHLLGPELLDEAINQRTCVRQGNDDLHMTPHGVYRCAGDDHWIAIACETDEHWRALAQLIDSMENASMGLEARRAASTEINRRIEEWTAARSPDVAQAELIATGVPAHKVQRSSDCVADPQLRHRHHFVEIPHERHGTSWVESVPFQLSRTPAVARWAGPTLGQHTNEVLTDLLGYDQDHIADLVIAGALD